MKKTKHTKPKSKNGILWFFILTWLFILSSEKIAQAAVDTLLYVNHDYDGEGETGSMGQPYRKLQDAVDAAANNDTLMISSGHYFISSSLTKPLTLETYDGPVVVEKVSAGTLLGDTTCPVGSPDCNRCVPDVEASFSNINEDGMPMGFYMGDHPDVVFEEIDCATSGGDHPDCQHWQGVQRIMAGGGHYFVVSRNRIENPAHDDAQESGFVIVEIVSKDTIGGGELSTNLDWDLYPNDLDDSIIPNGTTYINSENHTAGIQVIGNILAVGVDSSVHFYNLVDPENPGKLSTVITRSDKSVGAVAIAKLQNGRYLLVTSDASTGPVDFAISDEPDTLAGDSPHVTFSYFERWYPGDGPAINWTRFQNTNLITECSTGNIYIVGTKNLGWYDPQIPRVEEGARLYLISLVGDEID